MCDDNHEHHHHDDHEANHGTDADVADVSAIDAHRAKIEPIWTAAFAADAPTALEVGWNVWTRDHYSTSTVVGPSTSGKLGIYLIRLTWSDGSTSDHLYALDSVRVATEPHVFVWPSIVALREASLGHRRGDEPSTDPVVEPAHEPNRRATYNYEQGSRTEPTYEDPVHSSARDMFPSECVDRD